MKKKKKKLDEESEKRRARKREREREKTKCTVGERVREGESERLTNTWAAWCRCSALRYCRVDDSGDGDWPRR